MNTLTHGRGPGSQPWVPPVAPPPIWPLANDDFAIFTVGRLFRGP